jgi:5-methylcytosine-specific restriction endonuclease McrA
MDDGDSRLGSPVLVLNQNYEPLNITSARRAVTLVILGKAETLESDSQVVRSERLALKLPTIVKLAYFVRRPVPQLKLARKSILARDHHTCQYCGRKESPMTIDHVIPRNRRGITEWENVVCCCLRCNSRKGNHLPQEVGLRLRRQPIRPKYIPYINLSRFMAACREQRWRAYLAPFADASLLTEE